MQVLHLLSGDLWAGAEVASFHLLGALSKRADVSVRALLLNEGELARRLREIGVPVTVAREDDRSFWALRRTLCSEARGFDLVHAHRYKENLLAAVSRRPWVATQHGRPEPFRGGAALRMAFYLWLDLWAKRYSARRVIAVSSEVGSWLAARIGADRVERVWNGISDPKPRTTWIPWGDRPRRVGSVARLVPVKNLELAIDAVAGCADLEYEIVGDGPMRDVLKDRAKASGAADRIRFLGHEAEPLNRVARWKALLVPSLHEGNPISVLEALALGTPILAADLPGVREILQGQGGWIEQSREAGAWTARLEALVRDIGAGEKASQAARARYESQFTAEQCADRTVAVYRAALTSA